MPDNTNRLRAAIPLALILLALLTACSDDGGDADHAATGWQPLLSVSEQPWHKTTATITRDGASPTVTRAGETIVDQLKNLTDGFGLYNTDLGMTNRQVTWQNEAWHYGDRMLWPNNSVSLTNPVYAYAPYVSLPSATEGITALASDGSTLTFKPAARNTIDLMWAWGTRTESGTPPTYSYSNKIDHGAISLTFSHALAKLSMGTVSNYYGQDVTLKRIDVKGGYHSQGTLSLADGTWSSLTTIGDHTDSDDIKDKDGDNNDIPFVILANETRNMNNITFLQIPGTTVKVSFTFEVSNAYGTEVITSPDILLEQGVEKTVNVILALNHQVVIK